MTKMKDADRGIEKRNKCAVRNDHTIYNFMYIAAVKKKADDDGGDGDERW